MAKVGFFVDEKRDDLMTCTIREDVSYIETAKQSKFALIDNGDESSTTDIQNQKVQDGKLTQACGIPRASEMYRGISQRMETRWEKIQKAGTKVQAPFSTTPALVQKALKGINPSILEKAKVEYVSAEGDYSSTSYAGTIDFDGDGKADAKFIVNTLDDYAGIPSEMIQLRYYKEIKK